MMEQVYEEKAASTEINENKLLQLPDIEAGQVTPSEQTVWGQENKHIKKKNSLTAFLKKHQKRIILCVAVTIAIVLTWFLISAIYNAVLTCRVQSYLDGKVFIDRSETCIHITAFNGNMMSNEYWWKEKTTSGDINEGFPYKVKGSIGSNEVDFWSKHDGEWLHHFSATVNEDNSVVPKYDEWEETTIEEVNALRITTLCDHTFGQEVTLREATCSESGEKSLTCSKCGYTETQPIEKLEHNYVNKKCTVCGQAKRLSKAYNIEANTWYTYNNVLHVQNCKLVNVVPVRQGKAMTVLYYAVCQHCHGVDDESKFAGPEVNYPVQKIHVCDECGKETLVKFEIG